MPAAPDGQALEPLDCVRPRRDSRIASLLHPLALRRRRNHHAARLGLKVRDRDLRGLREASAGAGEHRTSAPRSGSTP